MERGPHASSRVLSCDAPSHGVPQPVPKIPVQPLREQEPAAGSAPLPAAGQGHEWDFTSIGTSSPGAASWGHPPPGASAPPCSIPSQLRRLTNVPEGHVLAPGLCMCGHVPTAPPDPFRGARLPQEGGAPVVLCQRARGGPWLLLLCPQLGQEQAKRGHGLVGAAPTRGCGAAPASPRPYRAERVPAASPQPLLCPPALEARREPGICLDSGRRRWVLGLGTQRRAGRGSSQPFPAHRVPPGAYPRPSPLGPLFSGLEPFYSRATWVFYLRRGFLGDFCSSFRIYTYC